MLRIVKNLAEIPVESIILVVLFRALIPNAKRLGLVTGDVDKLHFNKKNVAVLTVLFIIGVVAVFGYSVFSYNTTSLSAKYTAGERMEKNMAMIPVVTENNPSLEGETVVTVIESAFPKFMDPQVTYTVAVYKVNQEELEANIAEKLASDPESTYGMDTLNGYSKSKAKADDALENVGYATIILDKKTGEVLSYADDFE